MTALRAKLTYANVMATLAVFIALGGSSYAALKLERNSVGSAQIRARAVGPSELADGAVSSRTIRERSVSLGDIAMPARQALRGEKGPVGPQGPPGPTLHAAVNSVGGRVRGNAVGGGHSAGSGIYTVEFAQDVSTCEATATLAHVDGGDTVDPPAGRITVAPQGRGVSVRTYDENGAVKDLPFNLIVAC